MRIHAAVVFLCLAGAANAQTALVRGRTLDFRTGEPVAKALASIRSQHLQTVTNEKGEFAFEKVAPGDVELYVSAVDYGLLKQRIHLEAGQTVELEVLLGGSLQHSERLTVASGPFAPLQPDIPVQHSITSTELKNLSLVMLDDPLRAVQTMPGAAANNDWYAQFAVRGAGPANIGVFLDGARMSAPYHRILDDRGDSCSISLLDNGFVGSIALLSGNFPAQYGDLTGSVLEVETREGDARRVSFRGDVSLVAASASAEGPLGASKKAAWLASVRKDYVSLIMGRDSGLGLSFYDTHGGLTYRPTERHRISVMAIHGHTEISKKDSSVFGQNGLKAGVSRSELASLRWMWSGASVLSQAQAYLSSDAGRDWDASRELLLRSAGSEAGFREDLTVELADWNKLQAGWAYRRLSRDFLKNDPWDYAAQRLGGGLIETARFSRSVVQPGAYLQETLSWPGRGVTAVVGGRWDRLNRGGQNVFLPRLSLSVTPLKNTRVTAAAGQYTRFPDLIELYGPFGTPALRAERWTHLSLAIEQSLAERSRIRVEAYDRRIRDGVFSAAGEFRAARAGGPILYPQLGPILANSLRGYSRGIEFTLQRRSANRLAGWISYALGYARFLDTTTNGHFWSDYDQRHTVNAFGSYRINETVNLSASARYGSGFPVTGFLGRPVIDRNAYFPVASARNETRMPAYFRLDVRVNKAFHSRRSKTTLYAEITNLTNHTNHQYWGFIPDYVRPYGYIAAERGTFLGIIPSVGLRVEF